MVAWTWVNQGDCVKRGVRAPSGARDPKIYQNILVFVTIGLWILSTWMDQNYNNYNCYLVGALRKRSKTVRLCYVKQIKTWK